MSDYSGCAPDGDCGGGPARWLLCGRGAHVHDDLAGFFQVHFGGYARELGAVVVERSLREST
ncbi:MAG: hypothetical protein KGL37_12280, partial [Acidobacteriota bacterium]|nr:hypothetical protein [Acidobacteriota bacterium]